MGNHSEPNLQLKSEHNLKPNNTIDVEFLTESKAGPSLLITKKFLHIKIPTLKRNKLDDEEIDMSNLKYVCVLMAYITKLKNKVESIHHINIKISILKIYQEVINNPVFVKEWKDAMDFKLRVLISNFT